MQIISRHLTNVLLLKPNQIITDECFTTNWDKNEINHVLKNNIQFVQDNFLKSYKNVLRGLHYQIQYPQGKLVRVISGLVFDVVVDLRKNSNTFGQSATFNLNSEDGLFLWIPPGFAHGFYVISDYADIFYSVTEYRHQEFERILLWSDPELNINWPLLNLTPNLSEKDQGGKLLLNSEIYN